MKAPDKIYIQPNARDGWFEGKKTSDIFEEYIRKDALLEWAKKQLESWCECINKVRDIQGLEKSFEFYSGAKEQTELLIDKLNSM